MALGVKVKFNSNYSIAVSGIAGPTGGSDDKPVGTVWIAIASDSGVVAERFQFGTDRNRNIRMTALAALNKLRKMMIEE